MIAGIGNCVIAAARFSKHVPAAGSGAWIVSTDSARLFSGNQAVTGRR
jgi:hypothetical protein